MASVLTILEKITPVSCFNPDIGAFDGMPGGILYNSVKSGRPGPGTERCKEYPPRKM